MSILSGYLLPHAPVFIEEIGNDQVKYVEQTIDALKKVDSEISKLNPDVIIVISPHGPIFSDAIAMYDLEKYTGDFHNFGEYTLNYTYEKDQELLNKLKKISDASGGYFYPLTEAQFKSFQFKPTLDHGVLVPMHFLKSINPKTKLLAMSYGTLSYLELIKSGTLIRKAVEELQIKAVVIASGDMSHALKDKGPYDYHPDGIWFDQIVKKHIENQTVFQIFLENQSQIKNAAECGLRSLALLAGAMDGMSHRSEVISYQGPFGVGYLCAAFKPTIESESKSQIPELEREMFNHLEASRERSHFFVKLATAVVNERVKTGKTPKWRNLEDYIEINAIKIYKDIPVKRLKLLDEKRGVFVSIKSNGTLRGCIGTIMPTQNNVIEEIIKNAISACTLDRRFEPIETQELTWLQISVDVLSELKNVKDRGTLSPDKYGVIVYSHGRSGVLLPNLEGINTSEEQIKIACNKGGFVVDEIEQIDSFTVERYY